ncbi:hypothetical protein AcetOrient_orf04394 [Acetobacter orientalis]|uniref:Uncharacterized protein n=1 Tax=Acetobacter orientalis TaxID=146474 RepID=A0A2Z5ZKS7_9PROT|nr:hypothetical protein AcetOrient_orf04394 [Acetobacter orientalis]
MKRQKALTRLANELPEKTIISPHTLFAPQQITQPPRFKGAHI